MSFFIKIFIIIVEVIFFRKIVGCTAKDISNGFLIGAFLTVWPAIVYFKLLRYPFSRYKIVILLRYILYIALVFSIANLTQELILSSLNGKQNYILDNSGLSIIINLAIFIGAPILDYIITDVCHFNNKKYNFNLLKEEIEITSEKFDIDRYYIDSLYKYEIKKYSKKYNLNPRLVESILILENIYRGELSRKILENILCNYFYSIALTLHLSVGISQMKILTISRLIQTSPYNFKRRITNINFLMKVTCQYLKEIIEKYESTEKKIEVYEYIVNEYVGYAENKSGKVYTAILKKNLEREINLNKYPENIE